MDLKQKGLLPVEWAVIVYTLFTLVLMVIMRGQLHEFNSMLLFRAKVLASIALMWAVYRWRPCRFTMLARLVVQVCWLGQWYPGTYEFNRCFLNLEHLFCDWEQWLFACEPSVKFSEDWLAPGVHLFAPLCYLLSELMDMGYASYYPIIIFTVLFYFLYREPQLQKAVFTLLSSFFLFYVIFIFLPVAGPTFYFKAVGLDLINQGVYPNIGHYFEFHSDLADDCLPSPGWTKGVMWQIVEFAKWAGESPTAAFPSSHVGVTTVCLSLLYRTGNRRVFYSVLPFAILMFFATFYIQAHYAIDAIFGVLFGLIFQSLLTRNS